MSRAVEIGADAHRSIARPSEPLQASDVSANSAANAQGVSRIGVDVGTNQVRDDSRSSSSSRSTAATVPIGSHSDAVASRTERAASSVESLARPELQPPVPPRLFSNRLYSESNGLISMASGVQAASSTPAVMVVGDRAVQGFDHLASTNDDPVARREGKKRAAEGAGNRPATQAADERASLMATVLLIEEQEAKEKYRLYNRVSPEEAIRVRVERETKERLQGLPELHQRWTCPNGVLPGVTDFVKSNPLIAVPESMGIQGATAVALVALDVAAGGPCAWPPRLLRRLNLCEQPEKIRQQHLHMISVASTLLHKDASLPEETRHLALGHVYNVGVTTWSLPPQRVAFSVKDGKEIASEQLRKSEELDRINEASRKAARPAHLSAPTHSPVVEMVHPVDNSSNRSRVCSVPSPSLLTTGSSMLNACGNSSPGRTRPRTCDDSKSQSQSADSNGVIRDSSCGSLVDTGDVMKDNDQLDKEAAARRAHDAVDRPSSSQLIQHLVRTAEANPPPEPQQRLADGRLPFGRGRGTLGSGRGLRGEYPLLSGKGGGKGRGLPHVDKTPVEGAKHVPIIRPSAAELGNHTPEEMGIQEKQLFVEKILNQEWVPSGMMAADLAFSTVTEEERGVKAIETQCEGCGLWVPPANTVTCLHDSNKYCNNAADTQSSCAVRRLLLMGQGAIQLDVSSRIGAIIPECCVTGTRDALSIGLVHNTDLSECSFFKQGCDLPPQFDRGSWRPLVNNGVIDTSLVPSTVVTMAESMQTEVVQSSFADGEEYARVMSNLVWLEAEGANAEAASNSQHKIQIRWAFDISGDPLAYFTTLKPSKPDSNVTISVDASVVSGLVWTILGRVSATSTKELTSVVVQGGLDQVMELAIEMDKRAGVPLFTIANAEDSITRDRCLVAIRDFTRNEASVGTELRGILLGGAVATLPRRVLKPKFPDAPMLDQMNDSQREAALYAVRNAVTLIQGPPGTGKTKTAAHIVYRLAMEGPVLVCAQSNFAANNIALEIQRLGVKVIRHFSRSKQPPVDFPAKLLLSHHAAEIHGPRIAKFEELQRVSNTLSAKDEEGLADLSREAEVTALSQADVLVCTCSIAGSSRLRKLRFNSVVMDEAAQVTEPEALVPLVHGANTLVLVGDHRQLSPLIKCAEAKTAGLGVSLFERLLIRGHKLHVLNVQHRMHPSIALAPSRLFYGDIVSNAVGLEERQPKVPVLPWAPNQPNVFWTVFGVQARFASSHSYFNQAEAVATRDVVRHLLGKAVPAVDIGVITMYSGQRQYIQTLFAADSISVEVATVDSYQGREKDYIVVSCVRTTRQSDGGKLGFLSEKPRVNVSLTRARLGQIVIGDARSLDTDATWSALLRLYAKNNCLINGDIVAQWAVFDIRHLSRHSKGQASLPQQSTPEAPFEAFVAALDAMPPAPLAIELSSNGRATCGDTSKVERIRQALVKKCTQSGCEQHGCVVDATSPDAPTLCEACASAIILESTDPLTIQRAVSYDEAGGMGSDNPHRASTYLIKLDRRHIDSRLSPPVVSMFRRFLCWWRSRVVGYLTSLDVRSYWRLFHSSDPTAHNVLHALVRRHRYADGDGIAQREATIRAAGRVEIIRVPSLGESRTGSVVAIYPLLALESTTTRRVPFFVLYRAKRLMKCGYGSRPMATAAHFEVGRYVCQRVIDFDRPCVDAVRARHPGGVVTCGMYLPGGHLLGVTRAGGAGVGIDKAADQNDAEVFFAKRSYASGSVKPTLIKGNALKRDVRREARAGRFPVANFDTPPCTPYSVLRMLRSDPVRAHDVIQASCGILFTPGSPVQEAIADLTVHFEGGMGEEWKLAVQRMRVANGAERLAAMKVVNAAVASNAQLCYTHALSAREVARMHANRRSASDEECLLTDLGLLTAEFETEGTPYAAETVVGAAVLLQTQVAQKMDINVTLFRAVECGLRTSDPHYIITPRQYPFTVSRLLRQVGTLLHAITCVGPNRSIVPADPCGVLHDVPCCEGQSYSIHNTSYRGNGSLHTLSKALEMDGMVSSLGRLADALPPPQAEVITVQLYRNCLASHHNLPIITIDHVLEDVALGAWRRSLLDKLQRQPAFRLPRVTHAVLVIAPQAAMDTIVLTSMVQLPYLPLTEGGELVPQVSLALARQFPDTFTGETILRFVCDVQRAEDFVVVFAVDHVRCTAITAMRQLVDLPSRQESGSSLDGLQSADMGVFIRQHATSFDAFCLHQATCVSNAISARPAALQQVKALYSSRPTLFARFTETTAEQYNAAAADTVGLESMVASLATLTDAAPVPTAAQRVRYGKSSRQKKAEKEPALVPRTNAQLSNIAATFKAAVVPANNDKLLNLKLPSQQELRSAYNAQRLAVLGTTTNDFGRHSISVSSVGRVVRLYGVFIEQAGEMLSVAQDRSTFQTFTADCSHLLVPRKTRVQNKQDAIEVAQAKAEYARKQDVYTQEVIACLLECLTPFFAGRVCERAIERFLRQEALSPPCSATHVQKAIAGTAQKATLFHVRYWMIKVPSDLNLDLRCESGALLFAEHSGESSSSCPRQLLVPCKDAHGSTVRGGLLSDGTLEDNTLTLVPTDIPHIALGTSPLSLCVASLVWVGQESYLDHLLHTRRRAVHQVLAQLLQDVSASRWTDSVQIAYGMLVELDPEEDNSVELSVAEGKEAICAGGRAHCHFQKTPPRHGHPGMFPLRDLDRRDVGTVCVEKALRSLLQEGAYDLALKIALENENCNGPHVLRFLEQLAMDLSKTPCFDLFFGGPTPQSAIMGAQCLMFINTGVKTEELRTLEGVAAQVRPGWLARCRLRVGSPCTWVRVVKCTYLDTCLTAVRSFGETLLPGSNQMSDDEVEYVYYQFHSKRYSPIQWTQLFRRDGIHRIVVFTLRLLHPSCITPAESVFVIQAPEEDQNRVRVVDSHEGISLHPYIQRQSLLRMLQASLHRVRTMEAIKWRAADRMPKGARLRVLGPWLDPPAKSPEPESSSETDEESDTVWETDEVADAFVEEPKEAPNSAGEGLKTGESAVLPLASEGPMATVRKHSATIRLVRKPDPEARLAQMMHFLGDNAAQVFDSCHSALPIAPPVASATPLLHPSTPVEEMVHPVDNSSNRSRVCSVPSPSLLTTGSSMLNACGNSSPGRTRPRTCDESKSQTLQTDSNGVIRDPFCGSPVKDVAETPREETGLDPTQSALPAGQSSPPLQASALDSKAQIESVPVDKKAVTSLSSSDGAKGIRLDNRQETLEELAQRWKAMASTPDPSLIFFYSEKHGAYRTFSNFYASPKPWRFELPEYCNRVLCCQSGRQGSFLVVFAETAIMACKAALMEDWQAFDSILTAKTPAAVKAHGRAVTPFDNAKWLSVVMRVAQQVVMAKSKGDEAFAELLVNTGDRLIAEAARYDALWGIKLASDDPAARVPPLWLGLNILGWSLMHTRDMMQRDTERARIDWFSTTPPSNIQRRSADTLQPVSPIAPLLETHERAALGVAHRQWTASRSFPEECLLETGSDKLLESPPAVVAAVAAQSQLPPIPSIQDSISPLLEVHDRVVHGDGSSLPERLLRTGSDDFPSAPPAAAEALVSFSPSSLSDISEASSRAIAAAASQDRSVVDELSSATANPLFPSSEAPLLHITRPHGILDDMVLSHTEALVQYVSCGTTEPAEGSLSADLFAKLPYGCPYQWRRQRAERTEIPFSAVPGTIQVRKNPDPAICRPTVFNLQCIREVGDMTRELEWQWLLSGLAQIPARIGQIRRMVVPAYPETGLQISEASYEKCLGELATLVPRVQIVIAHKGPYSGDMSAMDGIVHTNQSVYHASAEAALCAVATVQSQDEHPFVTPMERLLSDLETPATAAVEEPMVAPTASAAMAGVPLVDAPSVDDGAQSDRG